jgi:hypothetical protein
MRKVKNNLHIENPAVMFAQGVESLINDPIFNPSKADYDESHPVNRRDNKQDSRGNLFNLLLLQFANN